MPIRVLPTALANQIAAGEVVERPASVLKELMENSLDAGAAKISVDIRGGGLELLRVLDDGEGMPAGELTLAVSRHATSKISALADLERLGTMGFRGEALPSIASVAHLTLISRASGEELGFEVRCDGTAEVSTPMPAPHPLGTTVEVRNLFFNTPARRKFLRAPRTEQRHVEDVFRRLALGRPDVDMTLTCDGKIVAKLPAARTGQAVLSRVGRVFGRSFPPAAIEVDVQSEGLRVSGWIGAPGHDRAQANWQFLYVNGRNVRDSLLRHALRMAYQDVLPEGRFAVFVLNVEIDPRAVDVNVHPTKHELRCQEARLVHDFLFRAIQRHLRSDPLFEGTASLASQDSRPTPQGVGLFAPPSPDSSSEYEQAPVSAFADRVDPKGPDFGRRVADEPRSHGQPYADTGITLFSAHGFTGGVLAIIEGRVLVAEQAGKLLLIDVMAARSAGGLARYQMQLEADQMVSRRLLLPAVLRLSRTQADDFDTWQSGLAAAGFECRRIGPEEVSIRAVPTVLADLDPEALVKAMFAQLSGQTKAVGVEEAKRLVAGAVAAVVAEVASTEALPAGGQALRRLFGELLNNLGLPRIEREFARVLSGSDLLDMIGNGSSR